MVRIGEGGAVYQRRLGLLLPARGHHAGLGPGDADRAPLQAERTTATSSSAPGRSASARSATCTPTPSRTRPCSAGSTARLIVSTKYTLGDFYSHLPLNPTLESATAPDRGVPGPPRVRGFGALPNDLGRRAPQALQQFLAANPHVEGVWNWTQDGGPLRAGPMTLYLRAGFWQLYDLNTCGRRLARDPDADPAGSPRTGCGRLVLRRPRDRRRDHRGDGPSREAITQGLYIGPYADSRSRRSAWSRRR